MEVYGLRDSVKSENVQLLVKVGVSNLCGSGPKDQSTGRLEKMGDMRVNDEQWGSCCRYLWNQIERNGIIGFDGVLHVGYYHIFPFFHRRCSSTFSPVAYSFLLITTCNSGRKVAVIGACLVI